MESGQPTKEAEMSEWKYGIYTTYNLHDGKWYAFSREDSNKYWNGEPCLKGSGSSANQALMDYNAKRNKTTQGDQEQS
jgi:hypothetical protein